MNIWKAQDEFHQYCINSWQFGFNFYIDGLNFDKEKADWFNMFMEMFDEDYKYYVYLGKRRSKC